MAFPSDILGTTSFKVWRESFNTVKNAVPQRIESASSPAVTDFDYPIGSIWVNTTTNATYSLVDNTGPSSAIWNQMSGTNTGDQTSIVGITGTKSEFDTALTDGDFAYSGGAFHDSFSDFVPNEHIDWTNATVAFKTTSSAYVGEIWLDNIDGTVLVRGVSSAGLVELSAGVGANSAANIMLYGNSHATKAEDIEFRTGTTIELGFDASANQWDFGANSIKHNVHVLDNIGLFRTLDTSALFLGGGSTTATGAALELFGGSHGSQANDLLFLAASDIELHYDHSASDWDFAANSITTTGVGTFGYVAGASFRGLSDTSNVIISSSTTTGAGANIVLNSAGVVNPYDITFRSAGTTELVFDFSVDTWHFQANAITTTGVGTFGSVVTGAVRAANDTSSNHFSGGTGINTGANIALNSSGVANPYDITFRHDTTPVLTYDHSTTRWFLGPADGTSAPTHNTVLGFITQDKAGPGLTRRGTEVWPGWVGTWHDGQWTGYDAYAFDGPGDPLLATEGSFFWGYRSGASWHDTYVSPNAAGTIVSFGAAQYLTATGWVTAGELICRSQSLTGDLTPYWELTAGSNSMTFDYNGDLVVDGSITAGAADMRIGVDGIYFEGDKHAITFNDGFGNFNLRIANNGLTDENCTEDGYIFHTLFTQATGVFAHRISSASLVVGNTPSWITQFSLSPTSVDLSYAGSVKLATNNGGVTVTGICSATSFSGSIAGLSGTKSQFNSACSDGTFLYVGDVTSYTHPNHSGHVTSTGDGATVLTVNAITGQTATTTIADADELIINDGGAIRRVDMSVVKEYAGGVPTTTSLSTPPGSTTWRLDVVNLDSESSTVTGTSNTWYTIKTVSGSGVISMLLVYASGGTAGTWDARLLINGSQVAISGTLAPTATGQGWIFIGSVDTISSTVYAMSAGWVPYNGGFQVQVRRVGTSGSETFVAKCQYAGW